MGDFLCFFIKLSGIVVRCLLWAAKKTDGKKRACLFLHWAFCTEKTNYCSEPELLVRCWFAAVTRFVSTKSSLGKLLIYTSHYYFTKLSGWIWEFSQKFCFGFWKDSCNNVLSDLWNIHQICLKYSPNLYRKNSTTIFQSFLGSLMVALQLPGSLGGKKKQTCFLPTKKWGDLQMFCRSIGRFVDQVCPFDLQTVSRPLAECGGRFF